MVKVTYHLEKIEGNPLKYLQKKYLKKKSSVSKETDTAVKVVEADEK